LTFEEVAKKLLEQEKPKLNESSVWDFFVKVLGNNSEDLSKVEKEEIYHRLSTIVPDFEGLYLKNVFRISHYNGNWPEFDLHRRINLYCEIVGVEKIIFRMNEVYQKSFQENKHDKETDLLWGWIQPINDILGKNFTRLNYNLNYNTIDTNKSIFENFVFIKLFEMDIKNGKEPYTNIEIKNYIQEELKQLIKGEFADFSDFLDKKLISIYLDYMSISQNLPEKTTSKSKLKI
jgi:hypothetical protein